MTSASAHKDEMGIAAYTNGLEARASAPFFVPDAPVPTQLHHYARLAAGAPQQEGIGPLRVSLALLARKTPPLAMGHAYAKPCRGSEGKKGKECGNSI
ncbi:unnamed protein product [Ectocarpus sp. CCAP 1310/34]|nr:unnamed protein product [Ectocarpus sp. CCAP 1310/34]